jgi:hypothetical protein
MGQPCRYWAGMEVVCRQRIMYWLLINPFGVGLLFYRFCPGIWGSCPPIPHHSVLGFCPPVLSQEMICRTQIYPRLNQQQVDQAAWEVEHYNVNNLAYSGKTGHQECNVEGLRSQECEEGIGPMA